VEWSDAAGVDEVPEGEVRGVKVGDDLVALYRIDGKVYATSNVCTHEYALLSGGWIENGEIECPLHGTRFRIEDGRCLGPYGTNLRCFRSRVRDGRIEVALSSEDGA
jgi:naphthalene 1,2-dioxygenase system ferredoxin subunit